MGTEQKGPHRGVLQYDLVVKTINTVMHRGCRGARPARREEGEYRAYLTDEQHSQPG